MQEADARFQGADAGFAPFAVLTIHVGSSTTLEDYVARLARQIEVSASRAEALSADYDSVLALRNAHWSVAALTQQGRVYESLVAAIRNTQVPFVLPAAIHQQLRTQQLSNARKTRLRRHVVRTIQQFIERRTQDFECYSWVRYVEAVRLARLSQPAGAMTHPAYSDVALARLRSVPELNLHMCIRDARTSDPTLSDYVTGEFAP